MEQSLLWSRKFIPVYFIVAALHFIFFKMYIQTDNYSIYLMTILLVGLCIASCIYNYRNRS
ncbi:hypothetical protein [Staphylococcus saprophyticus]|uniref:hypothetical protein n=1 Tax=Staphylococcus saprophyticus TaxID=29385 RepID=UPI001159B449|nr:hypothetical protein [Staphylococcus saprophyticus]TQR90944.1 hypothetical protein FMN82_01580 [Staphylococcus saprophyticus]